MIPPPPDMEPSPYPNISDIDISCEGIAHLLGELDSSKSHGPDEVPTIDCWLLKFLPVLNNSSLPPSIKALYLRFGNRPL